MLRRFLVPALAALLLAASPSGASTVPTGTTAYGADISWPNCPKGVGDRSLGLPMPTSAARFVVVGLTNGPAFTANPCLADQVRWVKARHLWAGAYSVISYPTPAQLKAYGGRGSGTQRLFRVGAAQANRNVVAMRRAGLRPPMVWVDVEPVRSAPWSRSPAYNNAVVDGVVAAYKAAGLKVGFYSYAYGWREITGGRRLPSYPTWVPSGDDQRASALRRCAQRSFSGGPVWMGQWTAGDRDHNTTCPGVSVRRLFAST